MDITVKTLMDENEMLSHIFLSCLTEEQLVNIQKTFIGKKDWNKENVNIPVEMKIGGYDVNPKEFFDSWKDQMSELILKQAKRLVANNLSDKVQEIQNRIFDCNEQLKLWEAEINWDVENPLLKK